MSFLDNKDESLASSTHIRPVAGDSGPNELNDIWRDLLGVHESELAGATEFVPGNIARSPVPVIADDPWGELLHAQGIELVDLHYYRPSQPQTIQISFSEQEVEQALQFLQEQ